MVIVNYSRIKQIILLCFFATLLFGVGYAKENSPLYNKVESISKSEKRFKVFIENHKNLKLSLIYYGPRDKPFYNLNLSPNPRLLKPAAKGSPFQLRLHIDMKECENMIWGLKEIGFFDQAVDGALKYSTYKPTYVLSLSNATHSLSQPMDLGKDLSKKLKILQSKLGAAGQKKMHLLIQRISGH